MTKYAFRVRELRLRTPDAECLADPGRVLTHQREFHPAPRFVSTIKIEQGLLRGTTFD
jgi:hypothetical protein